MHSCGPLWLNDLFDQIGDVALKPLNFELLELDRQVCFIDLFLKRFELAGLIV